MNNTLYEEKKTDNLPSSNKSNKVYPIWIEQLNRTEKGNIKCTFNNFKTILENDEEFAGNIVFNDFAYRPCFKYEKKIEFIDDNVITDILIKIEKKYDGINNRKILEQVVDLVAKQHSFNPIIDYLNSLEWDGIPRLATALSDYFGCPYSRYNEYCFRTFLNGAIARALTPGVKFDYMLTLYGDQGQGKSTFFRHLCGKDEYYQDNLEEFGGKKAFEQTENKWIVEAAEMTYMSKNNIEKIKAYITTKKDTVRYNYNKFSTDIYRRFVLLGTTNNPEFLSDRTGNRRFLIVNVKAVEKPKKSIFSDTIQEECDQIMAEAYHDYLNGQNFLVMPKEFEQQILEMQNAHMLDDSKEGIINEYLERRMRELKQKESTQWGIKRYYCCIKQLFVEALNYRITDKILKSDINDVALILQKNPHWRKCDRNGKRINTSLQNIYGTQKAYEYIYDEELKDTTKDKIEDKEKIKDNINKIMDSNLSIDEIWMK